MLPWEYKTLGLEVTIHSDVPIPAPDILTRTLVDTLDAVHVVTPVISFVLRKLPLSPTDYHFQYNTVDGRQWRQTFRINGADVNMTFQVPAFWALKEFPPNRDLRNITIRLIQTYGVTKIEATWM